jgi:hypothetical protein
MPPITEYVETVCRNWLPPGPRQSPLPGEFWTFVIDGKLESVNFLCPCGCGMECYTPVVPKGQPRGQRVWEYEPGPTITPSIRYTGGCMAHFNITDGKAVMHGDSGR